MTSQPTIHTLALWRTYHIYRKKKRYFPKQLSSLCLWKWVEFRLESQWKMTYWELPKLGNKFSPNLILSWHKNYFHFLGNYSTLKCRSLFCQRWKGLRIDRTNSSTQIMIRINKKISANERNGSHTNSWKLSFAERNSVLEVWPWIHQTRAAKCPELTSYHLTCVSANVGILL